MQTLPKVTETTCAEMAMLLGDGSYKNNLTTWINQLKSENPDLHELMCSMIDMEWFSPDGAVLVTIVYALLNAQLAADSVEV